MARLVAVPVVVVLEQRVQLGSKRLLAAHHLNEGKRIVGHIETIVDGCTLGDVVHALCDVAAAQPTAVGMSGVRPSCGRVDDVAPIVGACF